MHAEVKLEADWRDCGWRPVNLVDIVNVLLIIALDWDIISLCSGQYTLHSTIQSVS